MGHVGCDDGGGGGCVVIDVEVTVNFVVVVASTGFVLTF